VTLGSVVEWSSDGHGAGDGHGVAWRSSNCVRLRNEVFVLKILQIPIKKLLFYVVIMCKNIEADSSLEKGRLYKLRNHDREETHRLSYLLENTNTGLIPSTLILGVCYKRPIDTVTTRDMFRISK
jgi:hypothetical protein